MNKCLKCKLQRQKPQNSVSVLYIKLGVQWLLIPELCWSAVSEITVLRSAHQKHHHQHHLTMPTVPMMIAQIHLSYVCVLSQFYSHNVLNMGTRTSSTMMITQSGDIATTSKSVQRVERDVTCAARRTA